MTIRPSDILLHAGGSALSRYGTLIRRTSLVETVETHTRGSVGTTIDRGGVIRSAASNVPRIAWLDLGGDGVRETPVYRGEGARTNVLWDSSNFAGTGTAWGNTGLAVATATSVVSSQTAYRHTNDGLASARSRVQGRGVFTGAAETFYVITENVSAAETAISIYNFTASAHVCLVRLTWATGVGSVQSGTGTVRVEKLADVGPNGGKLYLLAVTATGVAGNNRRAIVYPTGTGTNTQTVILHHAQHEEAPFHSSVMVTGSGAGFTRADDSLSVPFPHAPQAMTVYARLVERGTILSASGARLFQIGASNPRFVVVVGSSGRYQVEHFNGIGGVSANLNSFAAPAIGNVVEIRAIYRSDGSVQIGQSINGAAESLSSTSGALALASAFGTPEFWVNGASGLGTGQNDFADILALTGVRTLAECREVVA